MNLFRNLLLWIALALAGALIAQLLLAQEPGYVLVRWRGYDYTTTVAKGAALLFAAAFALWLLWTLLSLPFRAWGRHRDRRARARIGEGFDALHQGHYVRAEKLLAQAADDERVEAAARIGARVCEIHTGPYAHAFHAAGRDAEAPAVTAELDKIRNAGEAVRGLGMRFNAGHALNYYNVQPIARLHGIRELHIGHAIVSRSVFVGLREAVAEMKRLMREAASAT